MDEGISNNDSEKQASAQWADVVGQLFDRLLGKGASVTYNFENLEIDMPRAQGPNSRDTVSAKWTINGKLVITAEAHEAGQATGQKAQVTTAA